MPSSMLEWLSRDGGRQSQITERPCGMLHSYVFINLTEISVLPFIVCFFRYKTTFCLICTKFVQYPRVACFILLIAYGLEVLSLFSYSYCAVSITSFISKGIRLLFIQPITCYLGMV